MSGQERLQQVMQQMARDMDAAFDVALPVPDDVRGPFAEAMRYAAIGGGKRMRPLLVRGAGELFGLDQAQLLRVGVAVEAVHIYSLVHDDLPAMDDDDLRRGKPTVHRAYDEATAILVGDALQSLAFEILADPRTHKDAAVRCELVRLLAHAAGANGMVGGQVIDMAAETAPEDQPFDLATVTRLQQLKTGALIGFCIEAPAVMAHIPPEQRLGLRGYAHDIGLAFQIADDLLDVEGDADLAGKALGKDAAAGKQTFVSLLGVEQARRQAHMLVDQAKAHVQGYGDRAELLCALADYVIERDR
ncbi:MAG: polyprenyl synthetase family protein [Sphingobium sp.]|nr:polyprenyl synthetase family protein [Sphingobium sp.]